MYQFDIDFGSWNWHATDVFGALDAFDVELIIFQNNMQVEVVTVIKPFL
jgi:hypothetical protein